MANYALKLVNGVPRMMPVGSAYDESITIVASGGDGTDTVNGPVPASTPLTLPASGTYGLSGSIPSLTIFLNGQKLEYVTDWNTSGSGPAYSQFTATQDLQIGDVLELIQ